jgi:hypothetical protein
VLDSAGFDLPATQRDRSLMSPRYTAGRRIVTIDGHETMDYDHDFAATACRK